MEKELTVASPAFGQGERIPIQYTGYGDDRSPELRLSGLDERARSVAVVMDDLDHPIPAYNHWIIWNLPAAPVIPAEIPHGKTLPELGGAVQGRGYGKHRYRGPKPPFHWSHRYRYTVYVLDCTLDLPPDTRKKQLLRAMEGRILQQGELTGRYR